MASAHGSFPAASWRSTDRPGLPDPGAPPWLVGWVQTDRYRSGSGGRPDGADLGGFQAGRSGPWPPIPTDMPVIRRAPLGAVPDRYCPPRDAGVIAPVLHRVATLPAWTTENAASGGCSGLETMFSTTSTSRFLTRGTRMIGAC